MSGWRRVPPQDGEGCPGLCDDIGYVYDCIDGCCVDPESGCDMCAMRCDYCWERVPDAALRLTQGDNL
jgi:hypothetical protein